MSTQAPATPEYENRRISRCEPPRRIQCNSRSQQLALVSTSSLDVCIMSPVGSAAWLCAQWGARASPTHRRIPLLIQHRVTVPFGCKGMASRLQPVTDRLLPHACICSPWQWLCKQVSVPDRLAHEAQQPNIPEQEWSG